MSIIERNISKLGEKFLENIDYVDLDYRGYISETEDPVINGGQVLVNDLKLWLQSAKGDYYRRWEMGGYFDDNLKEFPLSEDGAETLKADLTQTINQQFPTVEILDMDVQPNYTRRGWKIRMVVRDSLTGAMAPFETGVAVG